MVGPPFFRNPSRPAEVAKRMTNKLARRALSVLAPPAPTRRAKLTTFATSLVIGAVGLAIGLWSPWVVVAAVLFEIGVLLVVPSRQNAEAMEVATELGIVDE